MNDTASEHWREHIVSYRLADTERRAAICYSGTRFAESTQSLKGGKGSMADRSEALESRVYLLCGGRRTGTTLLAAILCSDLRAHPLGPECQILTRIVECYRWGRENFEAFGRFYFPKPDQYRAFYQETCARFVRETSDRIAPGGVLVLKNPEMSKILVDAVDLFPDALFLATVRDPRDQVASELEVEARRLSDGVPRAYAEERPVVPLAKEYTAYYEEIFAVHQLRPERVKMIRYEDLVLEPLKTLNSLASLTGLDLRFEPGKRWSRVSPLAALHTTPSRSDLFGEPISTRSVGRFQRDLSPTEADAVAAVCSHLISVFGY